MTLAATPINYDTIKRFEPLNRLNQEDGEELLHTSMTTQLSAGTSVFNPEDASKRIYFLIEGELELINKKNKKTIIKAGTSASYQPFGAHLNGQKKLTAHSDCSLLMFDAEMLELFLSWTSPGVKIRHNDSLTRNRDMVDRLLQSRGLLRFSETQIKNLLNHMKEVRVDAGDTVIRQNDLDDYYYIIKQGRCQVSRKPEETARDVKLAELNEGETFGEEALLTNKPRNATVTMMEPGALMRLAKEDFAEFLADPLLNAVAWDESRELVKTGAMVIDVRLPEEHNAEHIPGSINIPLSVLRLRVKQFSTTRKYILYCNDGSRSAVAAFLLSQNGLDAYMLDGGLTGSRGAQIKQQIEQKESAPTSEDVWNKYADQDEVDIFADSEQAELRDKTPLTIIQADETVHFDFQSQSPYCPVNSIASAVKKPAPQRNYKPTPQPSSKGKTVVALVTVLFMLSAVALYFSPELQSYLLTAVLPQNISVAGFKIPLDSGTAGPGISEPWMHI